VCVECCHLLPLLSQCQLCGLPLCEECAKGERRWHHKECSLLTSSGTKLSLRDPEEACKLLGAVTILRMLLTQGWRDLESHAQRREDTPIWLFNEAFTVPIIKSFDKEGKFSVKDIHEAAGVLDTNAFEVKNEGVYVGRALYSQAALINNDCSPNCAKDIKKDTHEIVIKTVCEVASGDPLTICYTGVLQPTAVRQAVFSQTKHFTCACMRCRDTAELGCHMRSLPCPSCSKPLAGLEGSGGACDSCQEDIPWSRYLQLEEMLTPLVKRLGESTECPVWQGCLAKLRRLLTSNHYIHVQAKQKFISHAQGCSDCSGSEEVSRFQSELKQLKDQLMPMKGSTYGSTETKYTFSDSHEKSLEQIFSKSKITETSVQTIVV